MKRILLVTLLAVLGVCGARAENRFKVKAFHVDLRTEVMTVEALDALAEHLAEKGVNTIIMEWEATFPFDRHAVICNRNAYTEEEVKAFISHCAGLGIDVIPLQHCFGHCEYILKHDRYRHLRENDADPSQVCPMKTDAAVKTFSEIFAEVASLHPSQYFHIGADETYLLGQCPECRKTVEKYGKSRLFVDYVNAMCSIVDSLGKTPVMWADIILQHPDAIDELPDNIVFVDWNYGWAPDRFGNIDNLIGRDVRMWGAGALRSGPDNWYLTQWMKHFNNLADFVSFARENGYEGMVETSWSTSGIYGYCLDSGNEILDFYPIRLVYPMSAFTILQDAFCCAVNSEERFEPEDFIRSYAMNEMGLDKEGADVLMDYFSMPQNQIYIGSDGAKDSDGRPVGEILEECISIRDRMVVLKPQHKEKELEHWILMLDMRINYLRFKEVEAFVQSDGFDRSGAAAVLSVLEDIVAEEDSLASRFESLNKGYVKDSDIEYVNNIKSLKMNIMYNNIKNILR